MSTRILFVDDEPMLLSGLEPEANAGTGPLGIAPCGTKD